MKSLLKFKLINLLDEFKSDETLGLTNNQHSILQKKYGLNQVKFENYSLVTIFFNQLSIFDYFLLFSSAFSYYREEYFDSLFILFFVLFSIVIGFLQEYKSKKTISLLQKETEPNSKVLRDGNSYLVKRSDLVPGDIVFLKAGDIVPADIKLIEADNLYVNEEFLNKSQEYVEKKVDGDDEIYSESFVIRGSCKGIVVYTGLLTRVGALEKSNKAAVTESIYESETRKLSNFIFRFVSITLTLTVIFNYFYKLEDFYKFFIFAISLGISVIPEALPLIVSYSLASGAQKLYKNKVLVKRITNIEDLGGIEVLCTDKTGTLTENKLKVSNHIEINSSDVLKLAYFTVSHDSKDPFDLAILEHSKTRVKYKTILDIPFDPNKRCSSRLIFYRGRYILITKGSFESISMFDHISKSDRSLIENFNINQTLNGNRVLLVGFKYLDEYSFGKKINEEGITIAGGISFEDPLKLSSIEALIKAEELGIDIRILSGDSKETTYYVANKFGLVKNIDEVKNGDDLQNISDNQFNDLVFNSKVFSRISPKDKSKIIEVLKTKYVVGYLGEGVTDMSALRSANIGIAVYNSSDIAREASDVIIAKKSLDVLIDGIIEGRRIFYNISKYIKITISADFGNYFGMLTSTFFSTFLPLKSIQVLLLSFISDVPLTVIASDNVDSEELRKPIKSNFNELVKIFVVMGLVSSIFDLCIFFYFKAFGESILQSVWFFTSVLTEIFIIFSLRTNRPFFRGSKPGSVLVWVSLAMLTSTFCIVYIPFVSSFFGLSPLSFNYLFMSLGIAIFYMIISEIVKVIVYRKIQKLV